MSKTILTTSKINRTNATVVVGPHLLKFNEKRQVEVASDLAEEIAKMDPSISYENMPEYLIPKVEEVVVKEASEEDLSAAKDNKDSFAKELARAGGFDYEEEALEPIRSEEESLVEATDLEFDDLTLSALKDVAKESELPHSEWGKLKKNELVDYLKSKI